MILSKRVRFHQFTFLLASTLAISSSSGAIPNEFQSMKYGCFIHYVWSHSSVSFKTNGRKPSSFDEFALGLNATRFADDLKGWGIQYAILTAWQCGINPLFPSTTMAKWGLQSHSCPKDLLGELIDALNRKGIRVILYTHPRDGHDLCLRDAELTGWGHSGGSYNPRWASFDRGKWNDFTNDLYEELLSRYGRRIIGIYLDEGSPKGDSGRVIDYMRLKKTILKKSPKLLLIQNFFGSKYCCDIGDKEFNHRGPFLNKNSDFWPCYRMPVALVIGQDWMAGFPPAKKTPVYEPKSLYRYLVLQASSNWDGGGIQFATGPYVGGGWEVSINNTMKKLGRLVDRVPDALKNTVPSSSWSTVEGTCIRDLSPPNGWGGIALHSPEENSEYLHLLIHPKGKVLHLPPPKDGKRFIAAEITPDHQSLRIHQDFYGITLTLPEGSYWDRLDTVIKLQCENSCAISNAREK